MNIESTTFNQLLEKTYVGKRIKSLPYDPSVGSAVVVGMIITKVKISTDQKNYLEITVNGLQYPYYLSFEDTIELEDDVCACCGKRWEKRKI